MPNNAIAAISKLVAMGRRMKISERFKVVTPYERASQFTRNPLFIPDDFSAPEVIPVGPEFAGYSPLIPQETLPYPFQATADMRIGTPWRVRAASTSFRIRREAS